jgi:glycosyltransferase involved in cell wall biosynthesis
MKRSCTNHDQSNLCKISHNINISIILATYNWSAALNVILSHLVPQINAINTDSNNTNSDKYNIELLIADDGSTDETKQVISQYQEQLPILKHIWHEDSGFRKAMILNEAVRVSQGEYLIFLDGDCIPFPDYIKEHIKLAEAGYFVAGNRVLLSGWFTRKIIADPSVISDVFKWNSLQWFCAKFIDRSVNKLLPWLRLGATNKLRYMRNKQWKFPKGCNFAVWRDDFLAVNGFDETFSGWGHEDADLFVRLLHGDVLIKDGRFSIPVLHLWHKASSRDRESQNYQELMRRLQNVRCIQATVGIQR